MNDETTSFAFEPTDKMIAVAKAAMCATDAGRAHELSDGVDDNVDFMVQQGLVAALSAYQPDALPAYEPPTCGSDYLACERALRIIECSTMLGDRIESEAVEQIYHLAQTAGAAFNRHALRFGKMNRPQSEIEMPF